MTDRATKTVLIISGGVEAVPGIERARALGWHVVVADRDASAPGMRLAHDTLIASTYDADAVTHAARDYVRRVRPLDGVLSMAADVPVTVASVAEALGLPGPSLETARLAADKLAMKDRFAREQIPIPWYAPVESLSALRALVKDRGFPLVLKPVDSRGARGVLRLQANVDLALAFEESRRWSPSGRVMVEAYLHGPQFSTESVLTAQRAWTPGLAERNYEYLDRFAPHMIENGGQQPPDLSSDAVKELKDLAVRAGRALGVQDGIVKGDLVLTDRGPHVIEIATRLSGGWFATNQIPLATGVDLVEAALRLAVGDPIESEALTPTRQCGVAIRYFFPQPGRVLAIRGAEECRLQSWVHALGFFVSVGETLGDLTNHTQRAGYVITSGATCREAVARAAQVVDTVQIETAA